MSPAENLSLKKEYRSDEDETCSVREYRDSDEENKDVFPADLRLKTNNNKEFTGSHRSNHLPFGRHLNATATAAAVAAPVDFSKPKIACPVPVPMPPFAPEFLDRISLLRHPTFDMYTQLYHNPAAERVAGSVIYPERNYDMHRGGVHAVNKLERSAPPTYDGFHVAAAATNGGCYAESCSPPDFVSPGRPESAFTPFSPASGATSCESSDESTKSKRFTCDICAKSYSTLNGLAKHKSLHCDPASFSPSPITTTIDPSTQAKNFSCKFCEKAYVSLGALKMHIRTHTLPCKCDLCGKAFSRPWLLQGHLRTHTGEKPFSCSQCGRAFADRSNLRAHLQTHEEVKKYSCSSCGKTFSRMSLLNKHTAGGCQP
ncbi:unnamed protein product [Notodromas monacha]|uniref:C2H2-type domain-containing protein n=1 Tax=Notodromas monacha TaxID=399045 RepID=A0A7R9GFH5_9CRUS|nr:unnamed protein product [Notodromas monacha]CAG0919357.1 unnamed protein product [Notodromas monacha]